MSTDERDAKGRFRKGVCPNPNGRPRKAKAEIGQRFVAILQEEVSTGGKSMPMSEVLFRTYIKEAFKHPKMFLALLPYLLAADSDRQQVPEAASAEDEATIEAFLRAEREKSSQEGLTNQTDRHDGED